jgi:microcystin-dependent protein
VWLRALCRGQRARIDNVPAVFSLIGMRFGGDERRNTTFNLPNLPPLGGVTPATVVNGVFPSLS